MNDTPRRLGLYMPAEWAPHAATWLAWPHNRETWPGCFASICEVWTELVRVIAAYEPVHVLAAEGAVGNDADRRIGGIRGVTLHDIATDDAWIRDHGPTFLAGRSGGEPAVVDWEYNAWGNKYLPYEQDRRVARRIADVTSRRRFEPGMVLEGGAIDSNGQGTLLAATECLRDPLRNAGMSREGLTKTLCEFLGAGHVVWIRGSIAGDDTDGHVDQLARFVGPATVVVAQEADPKDANHAVLATVAKQLAVAHGKDGRPFDLVPLTQPHPVWHGGQRLPAAYTNFYIANGLVVVPQFGDTADDDAAKKLRELFPSRDVVGIDCRTLAVGRGAVHCITQQEPRAVLDQEEVASTT